MEQSNLIAALSLVVSIVSALVSYRTYKHTVEAMRRQEELDFSREKSDFLSRINRSNKLFDGLEQQIKKTLSELEALPEHKLAKPNHQFEQLNKDLKYLTGCQRQARSLWGETYDMSIPGLAHHKAQFLELIEDDEKFAEEARIRCEDIAKTTRNALSKP